MRDVWRSLFEKKRPSRLGPTAAIVEVHRRRDEFENLSDAAVRDILRTAAALPDVIAAVSIAAERALGQRLFDSQIACALALAGGAIAEMATGEGKTLAAVPAIVWLVREGHGVHVLTANDYLARRDAEWMRGVYDRCGVAVASIGQLSSADERRAAYAADVIYATANEVGFDHLRDGLARDPGEQVQRGFGAAVIDEADSILIDEARIPLVIAGGAAEGESLPIQADSIVRGLSIGYHCTIDPAGRHVTLTPAGIARVERAIGCDNLFEEANLAAHTAIQDALHAHVLLRRDVDYLVQDNAVLPIDEFKGRTVPDRRWPPGLQTALECKERVARKTQGRVLGSITVENLIGLYNSACGMTGTAATQSVEFRDIYGLHVEAIPPHLPIIREDRADRVFPTKADKELAVVADVRALHAAGRPVLVGTASVEESERLSRALVDLPHEVLNARHEEREAAIVARAGQRGAVTISTNMAGRGVDIRLGAGVAELGGLHVIGTNRHESRRIDNQLRGRAGRQGDPGSSQFFVSAEDPLAAKYGGDDRTMTFDQMQRIAEGQNLDIRLFLRKYESVIEGQRQKIGAYRQTVLSQDEKDLRGRSETGTGEHDLRGHFTLAVIDELWADYLAAVAELRSGTTWVSLGYGRPLTGYLRQVDAMFREMEATIPVEVAERLERNDAAEIAAAGQRGATWTYLTTDEPFGPMTERIMRQIVKVAKRPANLINAITRRQI